MFLYGTYLGGVYYETESVLENIFVAEGNPKYYSLNGVLIERDNYAGMLGAYSGLKQDCIALYPPKNKNKSFRFPDNTLVISLKQRNLEYLENVYIPANAILMEWQSFSGLINLKKHLC